jgi:hypothetical protein
VPETLPVSPRTARTAEPLKSDFSRGTWTQLGDGPIVQPELPWETRCLEAPTLCQRGDTLFLFYAGGYNNDPQQVGVASSRDGVNWKRLSDQPLLPHGAPGQWNSSESGHPGIFVDADARTWLFFQGNPRQGRTWLLSCEEVTWPNGRPRVNPRSKLPVGRWSAGFMASGCGRSG